MVAKQLQVITYTREHILSVALLLTVLNRQSMFVGLPSATFARGLGHSAGNQSGNSMILMWKRPGGTLMNIHWINVALRQCLLWRKT